MDTFALMLGWAGIYGPTALGAIGSIIGCARAGQAACGAMLDVESGYGRLVGLSALPSSQIIYGIVVMFSLNRPVTVETDIDQEIAQIILERRDTLPGVDIAVVPVREYPTGALTAPGCRENSKGIIRWRLAGTLDLLAEQFVHQR